MNYQTVSDLAFNSGLIYFIILFAFVIAYVIWPKNREKFEHAARIPLEEDES
jgi:cytochrome c oxidase cbb3-type subunit 4